MKSWLLALDRILRGESTRTGNLRDGTFEIPLGGMTVLIVLLGMIYGFGTGTFALFKEGGPSWPQFFASAVKIPLLFLLTLLITFPSLYVFNALVGSRLSALSTLRLLVATLVVIMTVLASFGPIVAFFSVSTTSYSFMVLLNVAMCAVAGFLGLAFLRQTLQRLAISLGLAPAPRIISPAGTTPPASAPPAMPGALEGAEGQVLSGHVRIVFRCWMVLFAIVGSQMGWVLRPFIGAPDQPFSLFRSRRSNFFEGAWEHLLALFR